MEFESGKKTGFKIRRIHANFNKNQKRHNFINYCQSLADTYHVNKI